MNALSELLAAWAKMGNLFLSFFPGWWRNMQSLEDRMKGLMK